MFNPYDFINEHFESEQPETVSTECPDPIDFIDEHF